MKEEYICSPTDEKHSSIISSLIQNSISSFFYPSMSFFLTLWCPDKPYRQEVLQVVEECVAHSEVLMSPYGTGAARGHDEVRPVQSDARHTVVCVDGTGEGQLGSRPLEDCYQWHLKTLGHKHSLSTRSVLADHSWVCCYLRHYTASTQTVLLIDLTINQFMDNINYKNSIIIKSSIIIILCTHLIRIVLGLVAELQLKKEVSLLQSAEHAGKVTRLTVHSVEGRHSNLA